MGVNDINVDIKYCDCPPGNGAGRTDKINKKGWLDLGGWRERTDGERSGRPTADSCFGHARPRRDGIPYKQTIGFICFCCYR